MSSTPPPPPPPPPMVLSRFKCGCIELPLAVEREHERVGTRHGPAAVFLSLNGAANADVEEVDTECVRCLIGRYRRDRRVGVVRNLDPKGKPAK